MKNNDWVDEVGRFNATNFVYPIIILHSFLRLPFKKARALEDMKGEGFGDIETLR
jgi:hypothetical protein